MTKQEFDKLSENDKEDLCREGTFVMTIHHIGQTVHLYSIADGQLCQMVVRDPEEDIVSISLCDEQDLRKFISAIDVKDAMP